MRHALPKPDHRAVVLGEAGSGGEFTDRDLTEAGLDLCLEDGWIRPWTFPRSDSLLVSGVLTSTNFSGATAMRGIVAIGAELREHGGGVSATGIGCASKPHRPTVWAVTVSASGKRRATVTAGRWQRGDR